MTGPHEQSLPEAIRTQLADLRGQLEHTGAMVEQPVMIPGSDETVWVTRPSDIDVLLDQIATDPEQNLPYWAEIWPSGVALAGAILEHPERIRDRRVLELGCGVGITAAIATEQGAHLTVTDYAPEAVLLARITTLAHTGREPDEARQVNWRSSSIAELHANGTYEVILAADLLYERRDIEPLLAAVDLLLDPDGALWLAEPGRKPAAVFLQALEARGWSLETQVWEGPWPDPEDDQVTVRTHWLRRPGRPILDNSDDTLHKVHSRS